MKKLVSVAVAIVVAFGAHSAHALSFQFSFTNHSGNFGGSGEVTGRILGLTDNASGQSAASVIIDSFPAGFPVLLPEGSDATTWNTILSNQFTVSAGNITAYNFDSRSVGGVYLCLVGTLSNSCSANAVGAYSNGTIFTRDLRPDPVSFTQIPDPVPLPAAAWLFISALAGLFGIKRFKKSNTPERTRSLGDPALV